MQRQDTGSKARLARAWWLSSSTMSRIIDSERVIGVESSSRRVVQQLLLITRYEITLPDYPPIAAGWNTPHPSGRRAVSPTPVRTD
jgi:hypothetical protein